MAHALSLTSSVKCVHIITSGRSAVRDEDQARYDQEDIIEEHSFDELAMELADDTLTRARVLKLTGAALVGSLLGGGELGGTPVAEARRRRRRRHHPRRRRRGTHTCAAACTFGCCVGNVCHAGNTSQLCGRGGSTCVMCGVDTVCSGGTCVLSPSPPGACSAS